MESTGSPPPRTVIGDPSRVDRLGQSCWVPSTSSWSLCGTQNDAIWHHALAHEPPQGDQKLARQGHDHGLASTAGVRGAASKQLRQGTVLLEHEKSPRQLDHASLNSSVARTRQPFLPAFCAALVR